MAQTTEIVLPEDKPAWEWVRGRALQKVSPKWTHSRLQGLVSSVLGRWAEGKGRVGPEWRFRVTPPGEVTRPLVPDVAYVSYDRLPADAGEAAEEPLMAPDVAVEILSPGDHRVDVEHKIGVYLSSGATLVIVVDPKRRTVELRDASGARTLGCGEQLSHAALPGFALDVTSLFPH